MATRHDKEARYRIRGNPELASKYFGEALKYLGQLLNDMGLGGNATGHRVLQNAQGVKFAVSKMMDDTPIIDIDVSAARLPEKEELEDIVIIATANGGTTGVVNFIDADTGVEITHITFTVGGITSRIQAIVGSQVGPYVYVIDIVGAAGSQYSRLIRVDYSLLIQIPPPLEEPIAVGVSVGDADNPVILSSMAISPDGTRAYLYVNPIVSPDPAHRRAAAYINMNLDPMVLVSIAPEELNGNYSVAAANVECSRVYNIRPYDDGNPSTVYPPGGGDEDDPDHAAFCVRMHDGTTPGADLGAIPLFNFHFDTAAFFSGITVNRAGTRLYVGGTSDEAVDASLAIVNVPTFYSIDIEDDANVVIHGRTKGDHPGFGEPTGEVAVSHDGRFAYMAGRDDNLAKMIDLEDDADMIVETFPFRDESPTNEPTKSRGTGELGERLLIGPHGGLAPDNRVYFMSVVQNTVWSFDVGSTEPHRKISIPENAFCFGLFKHGTRLRQVATP